MKCKWLNNKFKVKCRSNRGSTTPSSQKIFNKDFGVNVQ